MSDTRENTLRIKHQLEAIAPVWLWSLVPVSHGYVENIPRDEIMFVRKNVARERKTRTVDYRKFRELGANLIMLSPTIANALTPIPPSALAATGYQIAMAGRMPDIYVATVRDNRAWHIIDTTIAMLVKQHDAHAAAGKAFDSRAMAESFMQNAPSWLD